MLEKAVEACNKELSAASQSVDRARTVCGNSQRTLKSSLTGPPQITQLAKELCALAEERRSDGIGCADLDESWSELLAQSTAAMCWLSMAPSILRRPVPKLRYKPSSRLTKTSDRTTIRTERVRAEETISLFRLIERKQREQKCLPG